MGEDLSQIEREISAERRELGRNLNELQDQAKALADWRRHYRDHTGLALGAAFGSAVILGLLVGRPRAAAPRRWLGRSEPIVRRPPSELGARVRHQVGGALEQMVHALVSVATAKTVDIVSERVAGFRDEFDRQGGVSRPPEPESVH